MNKQQLTTQKDCKPTILDGDTLMSGEGVFINDKELAEKHCIKERCCNNLQTCLAIKHKLDNHKLQEALELLRCNG